MKILNSFLLTVLTIAMLTGNAFGQKKATGSNLINAADLQSHMTFLASPLLRGRENGEPGLEIAQEYIVSQAKLLGLKPANGTSYYQPYTLTKNTMDPDKTNDPGNQRKQ